MTRRGAIGALAVTRALQVFTSLAATAVLAPVIAGDLGLSPALVARQTELDRLQNWK